MVDVFISYKQEEREAVQIIASALNDLRVAVWFDTKLRAGGSFDEEIAAALNAARAILVCWTPAAIQSEWVRGEATQGLQNNRLAACFLQPTNLIPPFNLTHAENLSTWAGQSDDPAWIKLLERIGELVDRPGLSTYASTMAPGATLQTLRAWVDGNGADPLAETVWARIALLEGEGSGERITRERAEAETADKKRKALREKSRRLARERGLRDPVRERQRFRILSIAVAAAALLVVGGAAYFVDAQTRERTLRDEVQTTEQARQFLRRNSFHPISTRARQTFERLDAQLWQQAEVSGVAGLEAYIADARNEPSGNFLPVAQSALSQAQIVLQIQQRLARMHIYDGPINGAFDEPTRVALRVFKYRWNLPVSDELDEQTLTTLDAAWDWWTHPPLDELRLETSEGVSEADYLRVAQVLGVDQATLLAIVDVEAVATESAFGADGRPTILFEPHLFSRQTARRYDESHPHLSRTRWDRSLYPATQEGRWAQLAEAYALDADAALKSTSWGAFQILGQHHANAGFETPGEFARFVSASPANQFEATVLAVVRSASLEDELRQRDWVAFARGYNGPPLAQQYGARLQRAYERHVERLAGSHRPAAPPAQEPVSATP